MNIKITPGAATDDAAQIDSIVQSIQESMETLDQAIEKSIPNEIQFSWAITVKNNWKAYYSKDVPAAMEEMKLSAANLRLAVEKILQFDQEQI